MEIQHLKSKYDKLLKDENFDRLELGLSNPNIFQILKITKSEIRHSNFLAWLLDPNQSHKLGNIFLKRFLRQVFSSEKFATLEQVDVEALNLSKVEIRREWKNIDILIILQNVVVCIENKTQSKEHSNQLKRYKEIIDQNFKTFEKTFVFLTPEGDLSEDEAEIFEPISYEFIVQTLERILSVYGDSLNTQVDNYIKDYITIIKRELMKTDKLTILSQKIYQNHKELFDFIFDHKPEVVDDLRIMMKEELTRRDWIEGSENKYYVRFLTPKIQQLVYYNRETKEGWRKKESFLFEIAINPSTNILHFKTVISPSDQQYNVKRLEEILLEINGFKVSKGKKWLVNGTKKERFNYEDISSISSDELRSIINNFYDKITPIIEKVEEKFLEYENELIQMKNIP